jgi:hypothetical protein
MILTAENLVRLVPAVVFLLNCYAIGIIADLAGNTMAAIVCGTNSAVIGFATIKWTGIYQPNMQKWEIKGFRIGGMIALIFGLVLATVGLVNMIYT